MSEINNFPLVAIDDGYAQVKVFGDNPNGGDPIKLRFRTSVRSGSRGLRSLDGRSQHAYVTEEGEEFTVSDAVEGENTQFDGFHTSPMNRVVVYHGLVTAGYCDQDVEIITGLPLSDFFSRESINEKKIEEKRDNLTRSLTSRRSSVIMPRVGLVDVGCQAVASWIDYALDDNLEPRKEMKRPIAIVDIGGRTTDIAVLMPGAIIDHSRSGTVNHGALDVYNRLYSLFTSEFNSRDVFPISELDAAVRSGTIEMWGEPQDVSHLVEKAVSEIQVQIHREIERKLGDAASLSAVVFVGGGSALFKDIFKTLRNGVMAEDPEFSNARGLWKYARMQKRLEQ